MNHLPRLRAACALIIACCCRTGFSQTLSITFDGAPLQPPGTSYFVEQYFESGMWFRPLGVVGPGNGFGRTGGGISFLPENGTAYLQALLGDSLTFSFLNGSVFNLVSVNLAEYSLGVPDAITVPFVGYRSDGSIVSTSFTTDGIIDGTGPLADFQTFHFGPEFSGLTRVEIPASGWSLDNLVVAVPEPGPWALSLVACLALLAAWLRKRRGFSRKASRSLNRSALEPSLPVAKPPEAPILPA